jgi:membrane protein YdbS with pleckstrin-like domain
MVWTWPAPRVMPSSIGTYLVPHERSVVTVRQHPAVLITSVAVTLAGLVAAATYGAMHSRGSSELVLAAWIAWGMLALRSTYRLCRWFSDYFAITSHRLLVTEGLSIRKISMIPLARVNDVSVRRSFFGQLLGYGELVVQHGGRAEPAQRFQYIPYPEQLYLEILGLLAPPNEANCPTCYGRGTVFRREALASPESSTADYRPADVTGSDAKKLLRHGYLEVVCPVCSGRQTVPSTTDPEATSDE